MEHIAQERASVSSTNPAAAALSQLKPATDRASRVAAAKPPAAPTSSGAPTPSAPQNTPSAPQPVAADSKVGPDSKAGLSERFILLIEKSPPELAKVTKLLEENPSLANTHRAPLVAGMPGLGLSPLMAAMRIGSAECCNLLLEGKADVNAQDQFGKTAPMYALEFAHGKDLPIFRREAFITSIDVKLKDLWGNTLLMYAAIHGDSMVVELLMSGGEDQATSIAEIEDTYEMSAKHGHAKTVAALLERRQNALKEQQRLARLSPITTSAAPAAVTSPEAQKSSVAHNDYPTPVMPLRSKTSSNGPSVALLQACLNGHYIPELVWAHRAELNLKDETGKTPLMHALAHGYDDLACSLIDWGIIDLTIPFIDLRTGQVKSQLLLALEVGLLKSSTIEKLVIADAPTGIGPLNDPSLSMSDITNYLRNDPSHCFSTLISSAEKNPDHDEALRTYKLARICLASAFAEHPGTALSVATVIATSMAHYAEIVRLEDTEMADYIQGESHEVGESVGALVNTFSDNDRECLFRSTSFAHFLRLAAAAHRKKMLADPVIKQHISARWLGPMLLAIIDGSGLYQWGGVLKLSPRRRLAIGLLGLLAVIVNVLLLPIVALVPRLEAIFRGKLDRMGVRGVEPSLAVLTRTDSGMYITPSGSMASGYSSWLGIWWRSFYLIDEPWFKFWGAQIANILILMCVIWLTPCVDIHNTLAPEEGCFRDSAWDEQPWGWLPWDPVQPSSGAPTGRRLARGFPTRAAKTTTSADAALYNTSMPAEAPFKVNVSQSFVYGLLITWLLMQFVAGVRGGPSFAPATTYASALASLLVITFFAMDHFNYVYPDSLVEMEPSLLASATFLMFCDLSRALLLTLRSCGPYVLMVIAMIVDVAKWLLIMLGVILSFASALYHDMIETSCVDTQSFSGYVLMLSLQIVGGAPLHDCFLQEKHYVAMTLVLLYHLFAMILMLNMLIAMMAKTMDSIYEEQELNYNYLFARVVISVDLDQGDIPAGFSVLRVPSRVIAFTISLTNACHRWWHSNVDAHSYQPLDWGQAWYGRIERAVRYTHVSGEVRVKALDEIDMKSERSSQIRMLLMMEKQMSKNQAAVEARLKRIEEGSKPEAALLPYASVKVYDGFIERASRLVFHYGDKFQHLAKRPMQLTILREGRIENELQELPVRPGDDPGDKDNAKLVARALTCFPFPQDMPRNVAVDVLDYPQYQPAMSNFVFHRENLTFGVVHTWPIKFNDKFQKDFDCTTDETSIDHEIFHPQATFEFGRAMKDLFGQDALERAPLVFARRELRNKKKCFVGDPESLMCYLQAHPAVCDELCIAKLYPSGFVAIYVDGKGNCGQKNFDFQPGVRQALYVKQGWETMASIKPMSLFDKDCELGEDITEQMNSASMGVPAAQLEEAANSALTA